MDSKFLNLNWKLAIFFYGLAWLYKCTWYNTVHTLLLGFPLYTYVYLFLPTISTQLAALISDSYSKFKMIERFEEQPRPDMVSSFITSITPADCDKGSKESAGLQIRRKTARSSGDSLNALKRPPHAAIREPLKSIFWNTEEKRQRCLDKPMTPNTFYKNGGRKIWPADPLIWMVYHIPAWRWHRNMYRHR